MAKSRVTRVFWEDYSDEELLELRFCDLGLSLGKTWLMHPIGQLMHELASRRLAFRPHVWLSSEWFSPDGVAGIAVPFFLAHPRLSALERHQIQHVEGGRPCACMRLLRHEAGHAFDTAYGFYRRSEYRELFGNTAAPYNSYYSPRPSSTAHVHNLDRWYAQSHPSEDFAETFAVWLDPNSRWHRRYKDCRALDKLAYLDELLREVGGRAPRRVIRERVESLPQLTETLGEHYALKRRHYSIGRSKFYDADLTRAFPVGGPGPASLSAGSVLEHLRNDVVQSVLETTDFDRYSANQGVDELVLRSRRLGLRARSRARRQALERTARIVSKFLVRLEQGRHRLVR